MLNKKSNKITLNTSNLSFYERIDIKIHINPNLFKTTVRGIVLNEHMLNLELFDPHSLTYMNLFVEDNENVNLSINGKGSYFTFEFPLSNFRSNISLVNSHYIKPLIFIGYDEIEGLYFVDVSVLNLNYVDGLYVKCRRILLCNKIEQLLLLLKEMSYDSYWVFKSLLEYNGLDINIYINNLKNFFQYIEGFHNE